MNEPLTIKRAVIKSVIKNEQGKITDMIEEQEIPLRENMRAIRLVIKRDPSDRITDIQLFGEM